MIANLPAPPPLIMPAGWQTVFTVGILLALLVFGGNAVLAWRRTGDVLPLLCLAGGAACTVLEPVIDVLGLCWYPREGQTQLFELLGRPIPVFVLPGYVFFMGGLTVLAYRAAVVHGSSRVARLFPLFVLAEVPFELLANQSGVYVYYGQQPLRMLEFPLWWIFANTAVPMVAGVVFAAVRRHLPGWRLLALVALLPMIDAGVNAAVAWPVWTVLGSDVPIGITHLAGVATVAMAALVVWVATKATGAARSSPFDVLTPEVAAA